MISVLTSVPKRGDVSKDVAIVQNRLQVLKCNPGSADGIFGSKTTQAISKLQKDNGLPGSGVIGPLTLKLLGLEVKAISPITGLETVTKDLKGKKSRHLHPTLRLLIEDKLFSRGIPEAFHKMDLQKMVILVCDALDSLSIKERGGNNHGEVVGFIQSVIGDFTPDGNGDSWCASLVQCVVAFIEDWVGLESPVPSSEGVTDTFNKALEVAGIIVQEPIPGSICCAQYGNSWKGHTWIVIEAITSRSHKSFEGNTGPDGGRDGDGAYIKIRHNRENGNLKTMGYLLIYPENKVPTKEAA